MRRDMGCFKVAAAAVGLFACLQTAQAANTVNIGLITTLSGPQSYVGADLRDGFLLAVKQGDGKLGGLPVKVIVEDDAGKPGNAKQITDRLLKSDDVRIFTGALLSSVADAMVGDILDAGAYFFGPNTSPDDFAGKDCDPHYFVTGWDETMHRSAGVLANALGKKRMFLIAPNYLTGKLVINGVKGEFKGKIVGEIYTGLDQTDFSAEIAQIRAAKPDVIYEFEPGGLGINFLKQFHQAGLTDKIPFVVASPSLDPHLLAAVGPAASNMKIVADWNTDLPFEANKQFTAAFRKAFSRTPTAYASHSYDTARLIGAALKASGGKFDDTFQKAARKADFQSVRGHFGFDTNQGPKIDWYELNVVKGKDGKLTLKTMRKFRSKPRSAYAELCKMK